MYRFFSRILAGSVPGAVCLKSAEIRRSTSIISARVASVNWSTVCELRIDSVNFSRISCSSAASNVAAFGSDTFGKDTNAVCKS